MESARAEYVVDRVDAEGYEPDIIDGTQVGEFHQIEPEGGSAGKLDACLWRSDPATYDYLFENDEAFYVVEGDFEFRVGDRVVRVGPGAVVSVPRGNAHTFKNCGDADGRVLILATPGRAAQMLEDIGAMVASPGPLPTDALARVYDSHDTVLVPPLSSDASTG